MQIPPHVLGVVARQTIKIINSDPTTHNIHPTPKDKRASGTMSQLLSRPLEKIFAREKLCCREVQPDPWMPHVSQT